MWYCNMAQLVKHFRMEEYEVSSTPSHDAPHNARLLQACWLDHGLNLLLDLRMGKQYMQSTSPDWCSTVRARW